MNTRQPGSDDQPKTNFPGPNEPKAAEPRRPDVATAGVSGGSHLVSIESTGESFRCADDSNVLEAMERSACKSIPVGCRNGGCGACKVRIMSGRYGTKKMNRAVVSAEDESSGRVLACKTYPKDDIVLEVLGKVWQSAASPKNASFSFGNAGAASISKPEKET